MRASADCLVQCTAATFLPVDRDEFRNPALYLASTDRQNQILFLRTLNQQK
jgi:hypothetical protein